MCNYKLFARPALESINLCAGRLFKNKWAMEAPVNAPNLMAISNLLRFTTTYNLNFLNSVLISREIKKKILTWIKEAEINIVFNPIMKKKQGLKSDSMMLQNLI